MQTSFQVVRVFGIPIRLDLSLLILMGILWFDVFGSGMGIVGAFLWGGAYALILLLSIVLHELGHSLVSMRFGCRVRAITLMLIGGRAELSHLPTKPMQEFLISIAGPSVSLALWLGGWFGERYFAGFPGLPAAVATGLFLILKTMNACLFWFNLIPAFPMDGGRVLRALLAHHMGRLRATQIAATLGRMLAAITVIWILLPGPARIHIDAMQVAIAGFVIPIGPVNVGFDKFMLGLIALFIFQAAGQEYRLVQLEAMYASSGTRPPWVPPPPPDPIVVSPPPYRRGS